MVKWLIVAAALSGCVTAVGDAGCGAYAEQRLSMPRPLPNDTLGAWVAVTDARMTGACR